MKNDECGEVDDAEIYRRYEPMRRCDLFLEHAFDDGGDNLSGIPEPHELMFLQSIIRSGSVMIHYYISLCAVHALT